jgi:hypothetical protein
VFGKEERKDLSNQMFAFAVGGPEVTQCVAQAFHGVIGTNRSPPGMDKMGSRNNSNSISDSRRVHHGGATRFFGRLK